MGAQEYALGVSITLTPTRDDYKSCSLIDMSPTEEFAFLEASYTIVRLLQTFMQIELADEETVDQQSHPRHTVTLVVASANGCKVRLTPR